MLDKNEMLTYFNSIDNELNPLSREIVDDFKTYFKSSTGTITIDELHNFMGSSEAYQEAALADRSKSVVSTDITAIDIEQLKEIEELAQQYYELYKVQGIPEPGEPIELINQESEDTATVARLSFVSLFSSIGLNFTTTSLASRVATLGIIAAIDGPLPIGDFFALAVGVVMVTTYALDYINKSTAISTNISVNEGTSYATSATSSIVMLSQIQNAESSGQSYFSAYLWNGAGGGIRLGSPISLPQAVARGILFQDTWARAQPLAYQVAAAVAPGIPVHHTPHNLENQPLNQPHWHASTVSGSTISGHHFYKSGT
jgi:hypothetical protein